MATIKQIAKQAGVSTATVSNVIHGKAKKVSAETMERVQVLINEMGYDKEKRQRIICGQSSKLVAIIIHCHHAFENSVLADPFYSITTGSIENELRRQGCYMMLYASANVEEVSKMLTTCDVDGVIAISFPKKDCKKFYNLIYKPIVSIDALGYLDMTPVPNIEADNEEGGYLMARHLLEQGYETIFVAGMENMGLDHQRWVGAQRGYDSLLFFERKRKLKFIELGYTIRKREIWYREIAKRVPFKRRTAFFFMSDSLAMEAISYWAELGILIPQDIGVAGFDNSINTVSYSIPRLTTINQDISTKGRIAVRELVAAMQNPTYQPKSHKFPISLVSRQSV